MPAALLTRRHLAWHTWLDLPVGLTLPSASAAGAIHLQRPGLAYGGPYPAGTVPGWLTLLGIANPGWVTGPGQEPWEVYVVKGDADTLDKPADSVCCAPAASTTDAASAATSACG